MKTRLKKPVTIQDTGEFGLIRQLAAATGRTDGSVIVGIGDDCAVLRSPGRNRVLLYTSDPVVENVHYTPADAPRDVGWKAMARNLSDIAAMAGTPRWAVVSIGLRPATRVDRVKEIYRGLRGVVDRFDCQIVGGDTTQVHGPEFIVVTLIGEAQQRRFVTRSGARPGDRLFVTGRLGGSRAGKHLRFLPRLREAQWLARHLPVHAMIDLSDGLASDLQRLAESSRVGFNLVGRQIPATQDLDGALSDGEDFELLFAVSARSATKLRAQWPFRLRLTEIGVVTQDRLIRLDGQELTRKGYEHFRRD